MAFVINVGLRILYFQHKLPIIICVKIYVKIKYYPSFPTVISVIHKQIMLQFLHLYSVLTKLKMFPHHFTHDIHREFSRYPITNG